MTSQENEDNSIAFPLMSKDDHEEKIGRSDARTNADLLLNEFPANTPAISEGASKTEDSDIAQSTQSVASALRRNVAPTTQKFIYQDFSLVKPPPKSASPSPSSSLRVQKLPSKLNAMLSNETYKDVISWMPHGRSWKVHNPNAFVAEVIPHFFEYANYNSFIRLVNAWGFRRMTKGPDRNSYFHELFLRGMPHLHTRMHRLTANEKKAPLDPKDEPNFYKMSEKYPLPELVPNASTHRPALETTNLLSRAVLPPGSVASSLSRRINPDVVTAAASRLAGIGLNPSGSILDTSPRSPLFGLAETQLGISRLMSPPIIPNNNVDTRNANLLRSRLLGLQQLASNNALLNDLQRISQARRANSTGRFNQAATAGLLPNRQQEQLAQQLLAVTQARRVQQQALIAAAAPPAAASRDIDNTLDLQNTSATLDNPPPQAPIPSNMSHEQTLRQRLRALAQLHQRRQQQQIREQQEQEEGQEREARQEDL